MTDFGEVKDSGKREEYASGMKRDTGEGKAMFDLIMTEKQPYDEQMLTRYAMRLTGGAAKYDPRNWEIGDSEVELTRAKRSAFRHLMQWLAGETDEDHAAAVWFNVQAAEYFKWRIAEKAKASTTTLEFNFEPSADGQRIVEILTGERSGMFIRSDVVDPNRVLKDKRNELVGQAFDEVFKPDRKPDDDEPVRLYVDGPGLPAAPVVAAFDGSKSDEGFVAPREQHRSILADWHAEPQVRAEDKLQAVSVKVGGVLKKRIDDWLQQFNMELLAGDLGDPHVLVSQEEFSDRVKNTPGISWQAMRRDLPEALIPEEHRVVVRRDFKFGNPDYSIVDSTPDFD